MRVDGQRIAVDYSPARDDANTQQVSQESQPPKAQAKLGLGDVLANKTVSKEELAAAAKVLNEAMQISNHYLQFKVHEESGRVQVKVIDSESKEVIREIPPERMLECSARIKDMIDEMTGILVDELV